MTAAKTPRTQDFSLIIESLKTVNKSVDKLSVKLDGVTNIAVSMSNEMARLDERVTFALDQQKGHAADIAAMKTSISRLESYDASDNRMKDLGVKFLLVLISIIGTGLIMFLAS